MEKTIELPKWFRGEVYNQGGIVQNPFSGESFELNAKELSMYDFIMGANLFLSNVRDPNQQLIKDLRKGLNWFVKNNPEAYMVLLD